MATHSSVLAWRIPGMGAWWAAVYGVTQSRTRLKQLSSSSSKGPSQTQSSCGLTNYNTVQHHPVFLSPLQAFLQRVHPSEPHTDKRLSQGHLQPLFPPQFPRKNYP